MARWLSDDQEWIPVIQEPIDDLVGGMERMGKISFSDLPDDVILLIFNKLDFRSLLRMRLMSNRMDRLQLAVKNNQEKIGITMTDSNNCTLLVKPVSRRVRVITFECMIHALHRLALNTHVDLIQIRFRIAGEIQRLLNAVSTFDANELKMETFGYHLPQVNLSILLAFSQNLRKVDINVLCASLTARDLCEIRETVFNGECKLEELKLRVEAKMRNEFLKECFGVTGEEIGSVVHRFCYVFRSSDESVELYLDGILDVHSNLHHFEGDLWTKIIGIDYIAMKKFDIALEKTNPKYRKIQLNHLYTR